jgi:hypothetical protein
MISLTWLLESQVFHEYLEWLEIFEWVERPQSVDYSILLTITVHDQQPFLLKIVNVVSFVSFF